MILRAQQTFNKVYLDREHPDEFIEFVMYGITRELSNKLMDELKDYKTHVVKLKDPEFIEDFSMTGESAIKQDLVCEKFVQCRNCKMVYPWCQRFRDELDGYGFCPYGKELESEGEE